MFNKLEVITLKRQLMVKVLANINLLGWECWDTFLFEIYFFEINN